MTGPDRVAAFIKALGHHVPADQVQAVTDLLCHFAARAQQQPRVTRRPPTIPVVLWKSGRCISAPTAAVADPPPAALTVRCHRLHFRSLDEVLDHLTGGVPETEEYVLQYVKAEPRIAVYLYAPEALALMESA